MNREHEIDYLLKTVEQLQVESRDYAEYIDTLSSPIRKRLWWWAGGYYFRKVGRWYSTNLLIYKIWYFAAQIINCT